MDGWPGTKLTGQAETGSSLKRGEGWRRGRKGPVYHHATTATPPFQDHSSAAQYPRPRDIVATKNSRIHCRVDRQFQFSLHRREMIRLAEATALAVMSSF